MNANKVEKIPIVDKDGNILGLITRKDVIRLTDRPNANIDHKGQLYVGAAVGVNEFDRVDKLINAGVDVLVVDIANGHS